MRVVPRTLDANAPLEEVEQLECLELRAKAQTIEKIAEALEKPPGWVSGVIATQVAALRAAGQPNAAQRLESGGTFRGQFLLGKAQKLVRTEDPTPW